VVVGQRGIVLFGLVESLLQPGVAGLDSSHLLLDVFEFADLDIETAGQFLALVLKTLAFLLEATDAEGQGAVVIVAALVLVLSLLELVAGGLYFSGASIGLSLEVGVVPDEFLDLEIGLLQLDPEVVNLRPQINNLLLVEFGLAPA
jgi:hypothetical protein